MSSTLPLAERLRLERITTNPRWPQSRAVQNALRVLALDDDHHALLAKQDAERARTPTYTLHISGDGTDEEYRALALLEECLPYLPPDCAEDDADLHSRVLDAINGEPVEGR